MMKTKRGTKNYKLPADFGDVRNAFLRSLKGEPAPSFALLAIDAGAWERLASDPTKSVVLGQPFYINIGVEQFRLYPVPDNAYEIQIVYSPRLKTC